MIQGRNGSAFALKPLPGLRLTGQMQGQDLERDDPIEPRVAGAVDFAHATSSQKKLDLVGTKSYARD